MQQFLIVAGQLMVVAVAIAHLYFMLLEMVLWTRPLGLKTFRNTPERAQATRVLAANQGLYNGFLGVGLLVALLTGNGGMLVFLLLCVVVAGGYGAWSVSRKILYVQAVPAVIALGLLAATQG